MKHIFIVITLLISQLSFAADPNAGRSLFSSKCTMCHGPGGMSPSPQFPNLAGQKEAYLYNQLKDFRDGRRPGTAMPTMTKGLTDDDLANVAAFISSINICTDLND